MVGWRDLGESSRQAGFHFPQGDGGALTRETKRVTMRVIIHSVFSTRGPLQPGSEGAHRGSEPASQPASECARAREPAPSYTASALSGECTFIGKSICVP